MNRLVLNSIRKHSSKNQLLICILKVRLWHLFTKFSLVQNCGNDLVELTGYKHTNTHTHTLKEIEKDSSNAIREVQRKCIELPSCGATRSLVEEMAGAKTSSSDGHYKQRPLENRQGWEAKSSPSFTAGAATLFLELHIPLS